MRRGFTLIELLLVIGVIGLLAAAFGAAAGVYLPKVKRSKAAQQVSLICAAMEAYKGTTWLKNPYTAQQTSWSLWDINDDGILDGDPELPTTQFPAPGRNDFKPVTDPDLSLGEALPLHAPTWSRDVLGGNNASKCPAEYRGFLYHTHFRYNPREANARGELLDPWGRPICVAMRFNYARQGKLADWNSLLGGGKSGENIWYAVWSAGPDGINGTNDDIVSWRTND